MIIRTKFNIGQSVWFIHKNKITETTVKKILTRVMDSEGIGAEPLILIQYEVWSDCGVKDEIDLFFSKADLVAFLVEQSSPKPFDKKP